MTVTLLLSSSLSYSHLHFFTQTFTRLNLRNNQIGDEIAQRVWNWLGTSSEIYYFITVENDGCAQFIGGRVFGRNMIVIVLDCILY
jgi:hypothetical protein